MPLLNEYLKLRSEQARELTWGELDANFLYVANPWSPQRIYKEGNIVYHYEEPNSANNFIGGYSWYVATADHGPLANFNITYWAPIGASSNNLSQINVINGALSSNSIDTLDFSTNDFIVSFVGSTANISVNPDLLPYWLPLGNAGIGSGLNNTNSMHTGNIIIGSGAQATTHKLIVYGSTNITGALTVGGTINTVNLLSFYNAYGLHKHTAVPTTFSNYSTLYPTAINALADFDINTGTLTNGHTLSWNSTSKKWVNIASSTSSLAGLSDVAITAISDNQILRYEAATSKWKNVTVTTDGDTGFSTAPFQHNHDTRYYTKSQLNTSGAGGNVHWNNVSNKPNDTAFYLVSAAPTLVPNANTPFAKPNYRVLTSVDNSVTITTGTNVLDLSVNTAGLPTVLYFNQNDVAYASGPGINISDTASTVFTLSTRSNSYIGFEAESRHAYYLNGSSISNRPGTNFLTPVPAAAGDANVWFSIVDNPSSNNRSQITAIARPLIGDNGVITAARQIINFEDTATIAWTTTDDGSGPDSVTITADFIGATGAIDINYNTNPITGGPFNTLNFTSTTNTAWAISDAGGNVADVVVSVSTPGLQDVTDVSPNGNKTTNNIEITTPADVATYVGGLILTSPNSSRFLLTVDDTGNLITTLLP